MCLMKEYMDLSGIWELHEATHDFDLECMIPGDLVSPLVDEGLIPDPYIGDNELSLQWIGRAAFSMRKRVMISHGMCSHDHVDLYLTGVDTCTEIFINRELVGKTRNQFREYRFAIDDMIKEGENLIEIKFLSSEAEAEKEAERLPYKISHAIFPVQSMHRNLLRKVQCHSGWDWGPCLMVSGLYGKIAIEVWDHVRLGSVLTDTLQEADGWDVSLRVKISLGEENTIPAKMLRIVQDDLGIDEIVPLAEVSRLRDVSYHDDIGYIEVKRSYKVSDPDLWWPAGYGDQPLYTFQVSLDEEIRNVTVGFRTITLDYRNDRWGRAMTVVVNGKPIFCKGANWIPIDAMPSLQKKDRYRQLLGDLVGANMNMVRIWGGGQYEQDIFYELCDKLGILVWQDCMFSCSLYPAAAPFLSEVKHEITYQIERLQHHPSLALWCGNNEDIGMLAWEEVSKKNRDRYLVDYDRLNEGIIGNMVRRLDPHRPWWPSSPSAGEGDYSDCWHDDTKGDMHYWNVWHEGKPFESYRDVIPRFCSEFGFQSFSSIPEMHHVISADQMNVSSPQMLHHQRNAMGNAIIIQTMARYFRMPTAFSDMVYLSQVQQAYGIQIAIDYWRSNRPRCMGALYWQLNDLWPVASWSSIEYSGRWKILHHAAKKFFAPLLLVILPMKGALHVYGINDTGIASSGRLIVEQISFDGIILNRTETSVALSAEQSTLLAELSLPDAAQQHTSFLRVTYNGIDQWYFYDVPQQMEFTEPEIKCTYDDVSREWTITTDKPAFYIWLESSAPGHFSDNGFHLLSRESKQVCFFPSQGSPYAEESPASAAEVKVYDLYHATRGVKE